MTNWRSVRLRFRTRKKLRSTLRRFRHCAARRHQAGFDDDLQTHGEGKNRHVARQRLTVKGIRPGLHLLNADHDARIADGVNLDVRLDGPTKVTVPLRWPSNVPILVRSLKGTIRGPDYLPGHSQPRLSLDLLEGTSGRRLKGAQTNDRGEFDFESAASGLYFLSLKPSGLRGWSGESITGLIVVSVNRTAPSENLDIDLGWTSCGLQYTDQSKCLRESQTQVLSGRVVDSAGATISGAKVLVLGPAGDAVDQLQSDREGGFASSRPLAGTYELVVSMAGFAPSRATAHVGPTGEPTRRPLLTVPSASAEVAAPSIPASGRYFGGPWKLCNSYQLPITRRYVHFAGKVRALGPLPPKPD